MADHPFELPAELVLEAVRRVYAIVARYSPGNGQFDAEMRALVPLIVADNKVCYQRGIADGRGETLRYPTVPMSWSAFMDIDGTDKGDKGDK